MKETNVKCPACDVKLEYKEIPHWSGYNDWFYCPRCKVEILYTEGI